MPSYDYTNYDFESLVTELNRLVELKDEWKDAYQSSTGQVLIQLVAAAVDQLHYMLERRSQENFLPSAKLKTSVAAISNLLGYRPKRITSPSGTLVFRLVDTDDAPIQNTDTITFPQYMNVTIDNTAYAIRNETVILAPSISQWQVDTAYVTGDHVEESGVLWTCIGDHSSTADIADVTTLVAGVEYKILTAGTTDFTLIGATDNNVGTVFTALAAGIGTGTVEYTFNSDRLSNGFWTVYTETDSIEIIEGIKQSEQYDPANPSTTLGSDGYILINDYDTIAEGTINVFTSTETYEDVVESINGAPPIEALSFAKANEAVYDVRITHDGLQIVFGDNVTGKRPDSIVTVEWIESQDHTKTVQSTNLDFSFDDSTQGHTATAVTDASLNTYTYSLKNSSSIIGGLAAEDVDKIKSKVPEFTRSNARAVTGKDYAFKVLDSAIGSIVDVDVYGEKEIGTSSPSLYANNVYVNYLRSDGGKLTQQNFIDLKAYMDNYKVITTHIIYQHAKVIPLQIGITLKTTSKLPIPNSEVYDIVKNALSADFPFQEGSLDQNVYHSDIVNKFHDMTVVKNGITYQLADYVQVTVKPIQKFSTPATTQFTATVTYGNDGDTYQLNVGDFSYSYTSSALDDANAVAAALETALGNENTVTVGRVDNVLTIDANVVSEIQITNAGTSVLANLTVADSGTPAASITVNLPVQEINPTSTNILESSVEIIRLVDNVVMDTDDGLGAFNTNVGDTINYITGEVVLATANYANGEYAIRWDQNALQNVTSTKRQAFTYDLPKDKYTDITEKLSTITITN